MGVDVDLSSAAGAAHALADVDALLGSAGPSGWGARGAAPACLLAAARAALRGGGALAASGTLAWPRAQVRVWWVVGTHVVAYSTAHHSTAQPLPPPPPPPTHHQHHHHSMSVCIGTQSGACESAMTPCCGRHISSTQLPICFLTVSSHQPAHLPIYSAWRTHPHAMQAECSRVAAAHRAVLRSWRASAPAAAARALSTVPAALLDLAPALSAISQPWGVRATTRALLTAAQAARLDRVVRHPLCASAISLSLHAPSCPRAPHHSAL